MFIPDLRPDPRRSYPVSLRGVRRGAWRSGRQLQVGASRGTRPCFRVPGPEGPRRLPAEAGTPTGRSVPVNRRVGVPPSGGSRSGASAPSLAFGRLTSHFAPIQCAYPHTPQRLTHYARSTAAILNLASFQTPDDTEVVPPSLKTKVLRRTGGSGSVPTGGGCQIENCCSLLGNRLATGARGGRMEKRAEFADKNVSRTA